MSSADRQYTERFLRRVIRLEKQVRNIATAPQLANSTVDGSITFTDDNGNIMVVGYQNNWFDVTINGASIQDEADQVTKTITALGTQYTILLPYVPIENSEHIYWNGAYQRGIEWSRSGRVVTIFDAEGLAEINDTLTVEYIYRPSDQPPPLAASVSFIGSTVINNGDVHSIALPVGTVEGDILTLSVGCGGFTSIEPILTDSRFVVTYQPEQDGVGAGHRRKLVAFGYADSSDAPVNIRVADPEGNGKVVLGAYRTTGTVSYAESGGEGTPYAPAVLAGQQKGILITSYADSGVFNPSPMGNWNRDVLAYSTNQRQTLWNNQVADDPVVFHDVANWIAISIGLSDA